MATGSTKGLRSANENFLRIRFRSRLRLSFAIWRFLSCLRILFTTVTEKFMRNLINLSAQIKHLPCLLLGAQHAMPSGIASHSTKLILMSHLQYR